MKCMKKSERFEELLKELEMTVNKLEEGNLSLEDSLEAFEKGIKLSKKCKRILDSTEQKVNILIKSEDGSIIEEVFDKYDEE